MPTVSRIKCNYVQQVYKNRFRIGVGVYMQLRKSSDFRTGAYTQQGTVGIQVSCIWAYTALIITFFWYCNKSMLVI